jgi:hypothetical protein
VIGSQPPDRFEHEASSSGLVKGQVIGEVEVGHCGTTVPN